MTLDNWTGKLKIKLVSLPANSKFTLGVAKLEDIVKAKGIYPLKEQAKIFFIDTSGATQNHQYNHIISMIFILKSRERSLPYSPDYKIDTCLYFFCL